MAPVRTPERAAVVPFVPTPTPTPGPRGALLFDVTTGEARILPGDYPDRRWLDSDALTFIIFVDQGRWPLSTRRETSSFDLRTYRGHLSAGQPTAIEL